MPPWRGKTRGVHVHQQQKQNRIVEEHSATHFQTAETFDRYLERLVQYVCKIREDIDDSNAVAVFVCDAAPQHRSSIILARHNIKYVAIPRKLTHILQPADQFIICHLKLNINSRYADWVESVFAANANDIAVAEITTTNRPMLRNRMYTFMEHACNNVPQSGVTLSWENTGILRALFNTPPRRGLLVDAISDKVADQCECGLPTTVKCEECNEPLCRGCFSDHQAAWCTIGV